MEEQKHTYTTSHNISLKCYYCKSEWEEEGVHHIYECKVCGKRAEGRALL